MGAGGMGGGMGGGGMGGRAHGGHHGGDRSTPRTSDAAGGNAEEEQHQRGLTRAFAQQITFTALARRIRIDDGEFPLELDRDGSNLSGPGVGGTVALTSLQPDVVIDTLTEDGDVLHERYRLGEACRLERHVSLKHADDPQPREFVRIFDRVAMPAPAAPAKVPVAGR